MKILYLSAPAFADCDFPLIKEYQKKGLYVDYLLQLAPYQLKSTLFNIKKQIKINSIIKASSYRELDAYKDYINLNRVYLMNRTSPRDSSILSLIMTIKLIYFIIKGKYDLIHVVDFLRKYDMLIYLLFRTRIVHTIHDPFPHSSGEGITLRLSRSICYKTVKNFILLNSNQKKEFCFKNNIPESNVFINKLGVYDIISHFAKENRTSSKQSSCNVLFFGRISKYKGIEYLCKSMTKVRYYCPDATLTIAGGGSFYFDIAKYQKSGFINIINRYISIPELADLLSMSEIVVCPYVDATQSGVIMTAYALKKPVVATNVGGLPEMVENGKTGIIVEPKNSEQLSDAIVELLSNSSKRLKIIENISEDYFLGKFSWDKIAEQYLKIYSAVI